MVRIFWSLCLALSMLTLVGCVQDPKKLVSQDEFTEAMGKLNQTLQSIQQQANRTDERTEIVNDVVGEIQQRVNLTLQRQQEFGAELGQLVMQDEFGRRHHRFDTNNQSLRAEFDRAMKSTIPKMGTLVLHNCMSRNQHVYVNHEGYEDRYLVRAGRSRTLPVRTGTISVRLQDQEAKYWNVGFPNYSFALDIRMPERDDALDPWSSQGGLSYLRAENPRSDGMYAVR